MRNTMTGLSDYLTSVKGNLFERTEFVSCLKQSLNDWTLFLLSTELQIIDICWSSNLMDKTRESLNMNKY